MSKSGGFLGTLKSFVVEESNEAATDASPGDPMTYPVAVSVQADAAIRAILEQELESVPQPSYGEFYAMSSSMAAVIPDEATRGRAALAALAGKNITIAEIMADIDQCLRKLDEKEGENTRLSADAFKRRVVSKEEQIADVVQRIQICESEIKELAAQKMSLVTEVARERSEIDETNRRFVNTAAALRQELTNRKNNIAKLGA